MKKKTTEENRSEFFEYLIDNNLTEEDYIQIDMQPSLGSDFRGMPSLEGNLDFPYLNCFIYNGYNYEIRENRYYVIMVYPYLGIKEDLKIYTRDKKIDQLGI